MAEQILEKLFESVPKVRVLRLFMRSPETKFTFSELISRSQIRARTLRKELAKLLKLGIIKNRVARIQYEVRRKTGSHRKPLQILVKNKRARVFYANPDFKLLPELRGLVTKASVASRSRLLRQLQGLGKIKLAVLSGIFLRSDNSRTDLLIVGEGIKRRQLETLLAQLESDLGIQLRYTVMDTPEFRYRLDMYDRFLRDILEYPHEKLINKLRV